MIKEITDEGAMNLMAAIIKQAAHDVEHGSKFMREEAERFFKEDPYGVMNNLTGEDVVRILNMK